MAPKSPLLLFIIIISFHVDLCTDWPEGLVTDDDCNKHFPVEVTTRDYVVDSASIRDPRARPVTVKV